MISAILLFIAGMLNALMDRVENETIWKSCFKKLNQNFWYKRVSWNKAKKVFKFKLDAWHIAKHLMYVHVVGAVVFYSPIFGWKIDLPLLCTVLTLSFVLFYDVIFSSK